MAYVASELTHFVGSKLKRDCPDDYERAQYDLLVNEILKNCILRDPRTSPGLTMDFKRPLTSGELLVPGVVCFCDIPVAELGIHMAKYSRFGLSFKKGFLRRRGVNPVFYIDTCSKIRMDEARFARDMKTWRERKKRVEGTECLTDCCRKECFEGAIKEWLLDVCDSVPTVVLFQVLAFWKFFDSTCSDEDSENYYMEREWRMHGPLQFEIGDVCRIIIPQSFAEEFRRAVPDCSGKIKYAECITQSGSP